jgi:hypothetical protein
VASYGPGQTPGKAPLPLWGTLALQPGPRFQQIGDGDGGASPSPDKSGTVTGTGTGVSVPWNGLEGAQMSNELESASDLVVNLELLEPMVLSGYYETEAESPSSTTLKPATPTCNATCNMH